MHTNSMANNALRSPGVFFEETLAPPRKLGCSPPLTPLSKVFPFQRDPLLLPGGNGKYLASIFFNRVCSFSANLFLFRYFPFFIALTVISLFQFLGTAHFPPIFKLFSCPLVEQGSYFSPFVLIRNLT